MLEASVAVDIKHIHSTTNLLALLLKDRLVDIVPAYDSIAIFTSESYERLAEALNQSARVIDPKENKSEVVILPVCYELGLDWDRLEKHTKWPKERLISIHLSGTYRNVFMGFTPGFIYADGLDERLACPRLSNPRTMIEAGSVGIGGSQTGIYSLSSPGGWNVIGRTPISLFDVCKNPPVKIDVGERFRFERISEKAFWEWGS